MKYLLFLIAVIPLLFNPVYATLHPQAVIPPPEIPSQYTIPYLNNELWIRNNNPNVCIVTSPYYVSDSGVVTVYSNINYTQLGLTETTITAVNEWQDKLNSATNSHKFNMNIITMSDVRQSLDHYYCDVIVLYAAIPAFEDAAGITFPVNIWRTFNVITVGYGEGTYQNFTYYTKDYLVVIAEHELGHTFGLNHLQGGGIEPNGMCDTFYTQLSIMNGCHPTYDDSQKMGITKYDVNAVIQRYTDSGFGVLNSNAGSSYTLYNIEAIDTAKQNQTPPTTTTPPPANTNDKCFDLRFKHPTYKIGEPIILCGPLGYGLQSQITIDIFGPDDKETDHFFINIPYSNSFSVTLDPEKYQTVGRYGLVLDYGAGSVFYSAFNIEKGNTPTQPSPTQPNTEPTSIPSWVKNNAKWWSEGSVGDGDFVKGMQYLIQQGIVKVSQTQQGTAQSQQIPSWIKNNAGWWANDQISDAEFLKGIQYLVSTGIIKAS